MRGQAGACAPTRRLDLRPNVESLAVSEFNVLKSRGFSATGTRVAGLSIRAHIEDVMTMQQARDEYFRLNGFGDDGGYSDPTVTVRVFGLPISIPNTAGRKKAVVFHDMHHLVTGYATDNLGEAEISGYELGSGCADYPAALVLNTLALLLGIFVAPGRIFAAFVRGRTSRNLYGRDASALLGREVEEVRAELGLDVEPRPATMGDAAAFAGYVAASLASIALPGALLWFGLRAVL